MLTWVNYWSTPFTLASFQPLPAHHAHCNSCQLPSLLTPLLFSGQQTSKRFEDYFSVWQQSSDCQNRGKQGMDPSCAAALYTTGTITTWWLILSLKCSQIVNKVVEWWQTEGAWLWMQGALLKQLIGKPRVKERKFGSTDSPVEGWQCPLPTPYGLCLRTSHSSVPRSSACDIPSILEKGFAWRKPSLCC